MSGLRPRAASSRLSGLRVRLIKSPKREKKWRVIFPDKTHVDFGSSPYQDMLMHQDPIRRDKYILRHRSRENWNKSGFHTAGFWSRWLLWSKPTMTNAKALIKKKFNISIS